MVQQTITEFEHGAIRWDARLDAVVTEWTEYTSGESFREGMTTALECLRERGATKSLSDSRAMNVLPQEDQQWIGEEWIPRAIDAGLEQSAVVYGESVIAKMSLERFSREMEDLPMDMFVTDDLDEAREYLRE